MTHTHVNMTWGAPASYSSAILSGGVIFVSGQLGADPDGADIDLEEQCRVALERLIETIRASGGDVDTILRIGGYLADIGDFPTYDAVYRSLVVTEPMPARTTIEVGGFVRPIRVEVDGIARVKEIT